MISTRDLSKLPDIDGLRRLLQSLAMLDAILCPEWVFRWYSFNSKWSKGEQMGSMRNNHGDDFFVHFTEAGCWFQGFWHESSMSPWRESPPELWPGLLDKVPDVFVPSVAEPAFATHEHTTFCFWRQYGDTEWQISDIDYPIGEEDPDGSKWMLSILDGQPATYLPHARHVSSLEPSVSAIRQVYDHKPLTAELVEELNPEITLQSLKDDIAEIGYPT